jgi:hypothetical protein
LRASLPVSRYDDRVSITVSGMPERVRKVICYVVRDGKRELGVCEHEVYDRSRGAERHELHERHVFQLDPPPDLLAHWSHLAEPGEGDFWFEFSWSPLGPGVVLAGDQHAMLSRIKDRS